MAVGARFSFNCYYQHIAILVKHGAIGKSVIVSSQEGVTQGDHIFMIFYGIGILLLTLTLKSGFPAAKQQLFEDDGQMPERLQTSVRSLSDFSNLVPIAIYTSQNRRRAS